MVSEIPVYHASEGVAQQGSSSPGQEGEKQNTPETSSFIPSGQWGNIISVG